MAQVPGAAADSQDIIGLADLRSEFDIAAEDNTFDGSLIRFIRAGCSKASSLLGGNVLDTEQVFIVAPPEDRSAPLSIPVRWAKSVSAIAYWTVASPSASAAPDGNIVPATVRFEYRGSYQGGDGDPLSACSGLRMAGDAAGDALPGDRRNWPWT